MYSMVAAWSYDRGDRIMVREVVTLRLKFACGVVGRKIVEAGRLRV